MLRHLLQAKFVLPFALLLASGCAQTRLLEDKAPPQSDVARGKEYVVLTAKQNDTFQSLASQYLGDKSKGWMLADFNKTEKVVAGQQIVIPLVHPNPVGVYSDGYQTVPILTYHRFGSKRERMVVTSEAFTSQMAYLRDNGYRVIPLSSLLPFLKGEAALPQRSVVITLDDGYRSSHEIAYPILKKFGFPATIFIYSDFVGARDAMSWGAMRDMTASGLIDFQPHSKSHPHLAHRQRQESSGAYQARIAEEIKAPGQKIHQQLGQPLYSFAYPYGETNDLIIAELKDNNYQLGVTVHTGGNPAFAYPFRLRRTMIYGDRDLDSFAKTLEVFKQQTLR